LDAVVDVVALPVNAPVNEVDDTEVNPANVVEDDPKDIDVVPIVTALFAKFALLIPAVPLKFPFVKPVIVLLPAAIVLLVKISAPANVANVPPVGKVNVVAPVVLSVNVFAPVVLKSPAVVMAPVVLMLPPKVIVFTPLFFPVPP
jgi:hypothetical protein